MGYLTEWLHKTLRLNTEVFYSHKKGKKPRGCRRSLFHRKGAFINEINGTLSHLHFRKIYFFSSINHLKLQVRNCWSVEHKENPKTLKPLICSKADHITDWTAICKTASLLWHQDSPNPVLLDLRWSSKTIRSSEIFANNTGKVYFFHPFTVMPLNKTQCN